MNWMKWVFMGMQILSQLPQLIVATEQIIGGGNGEVKKKLVSASVSAAAEMAGVDGEGKTALLNAADAAIDAEVEIMNSINILKKKDPPQSDTEDDL